MRDSNCCPTGTTTTTIIHVCTVHSASGVKTNPCENEHYRVLRFPNFNNGNIAVDQMYCTAFLGVQVKKNCLASLIALTPTFSYSNIAGRQKLIFFKFAKFLLLLEKNTFQKENSKSEFFTFVLAPKIVFNLVKGKQNCFSSVLINF